MEKHIKGRGEKKTKQNVTKNKVQKSTTSGPFIGLAVPTVTSDFVQWQVQALI